MTIDDFSVLWNPSLFPLFSTDAGFSSDKSNKDFNLKYHQIKKSHQQIDGTFHLTTGTETFLNSLILLNFKT